jgi:chromosome segregation ATPase
VLVLVRRAENDDPVAQERQALAGQRAELEALKRQLAERVAAVKEREDELRAALARVAAGQAPGVRLPAQVDPNADRLAARAASLAERERAVAAREAAFAAGHSSANGEAALAEQAAALQARARELDARLAELEARERAVEERERVPRDPDEARLAEIEARLDELRAAEEAFLRTRRELADHSDAIAAREQLLAQRERELDEREDGWGGPDVRELEARLRRLETQRRAPGTAQGFSGGFRKLEQEGTRRPPSQ